MPDAARAPRAIWAGAGGPGRAMAWRGQQQTVGAGPRVMPTCRRRVARAACGAQGGGRAVSRARAQGRRVPGRAGDRHLPGRPSRTTSGGNDPRKGRGSGGAGALDAQRMASGAGRARDAPGSVEAAGPVGVGAGVPLASCLAGTAGRKGGGFRHVASGREAGLSGQGTAQGLRGARMGWGAAFAGLFPKVRRRGTESCLQGRQGARAPAGRVGRGRRGVWWRHRGRSGLGRVFHWPAALGRGWAEGRRLPARCRVAGRPGFQPKGPPKDCAGRAWGGALPSRAFSPE